MARNTKQAASLDRNQETATPASDLEFAIESMARCLLPHMQAFFASEEGKAAYESWKMQKKGG